MRLDRFRFRELTDEHDSLLLRRGRRIYRTCTLAYKSVAPVSAGTVESSRGEHRGSAEALGGERLGSHPPPPPQKKRRIFRDASRKRVKRFFPGKRGRTGRPGGPNPHNGQESIDRGIDRSIEETIQSIDKSIG